MNVFRTSTLEYDIIETLRGKAMTEPQLRTALERRGISPTRQGIYRVLRILQKKEIVVSVKGVFQLSKIWVGQMKQFFAATAAAKPKEFIDYEKLSEGDSISFSFSSPLTADTFWTNSYIELVNMMKPQGSVLLYNPTEWFLFARGSSEKQLMAETLAAQQSWLILVGEDSRFDSAMRAKFYKNETTEYHKLSKRPFRDNYYVNVFEDFCIEVFLDTTIQQNIDSWYRATRIADAGSIKQLQSLLSQKGSNKIVISRNAKKAAQIRKLFQKYFIL